MPAQRKHENAAACQAAYRARQKEARRREREQKGLPDLPPIPAMPGERRWTAMIREARALLATVQQERDAYFDERSDAWRESEKGDAFLERTEALQEAVEALEALDAD